MSRAKCLFFVHFILFYLHCFQREKTIERDSNWNEKMKILEKCYIDSIVSMVSLHIESINTHEKHWISIPNAYVFVTGPCRIHEKNIPKCNQFHSIKIADPIIQIYRIWTYADLIETRSEKCGMELQAHTHTHNQSCLNIECIVNRSRKCMQ